MEALLYCGCGLDVHKEVIEACILRGLGAEPEVIRRSFGTTKPELQQLMDWLGEHDCYTVAMESTGVYWKPIYQTLETESKYIEQIWVVNARHMRNLPGRKTDVQDAEWIATLLRHGLLEKSFVQRSEGVCPPVSDFCAGTVSLCKSSGEILTGSRFLVFIGYERYPLRNRKKASGYFA